MSSIRLSGTSSGYYDLTVPAAAGTNSIDLSNLATTNTANTFNNVVTVQNGGFDARLRLQNTGAGGTTFDMYSTMNSFAQGSETLLVNYGGSPNNVPNGLMKIKSNGCINFPYQPAFKTGVVSRNATGSDRVLSTTNGDTFNHQTRDSHNVGSHWNSTTGRFTCPVAGTYMFYCSLMRHGSNGTVLENRIKKNGGLMFARAYASGYTSNYQQSMIDTTTICAVNDYIEFFVQGTKSVYQDDTYLGGY